MAFRVGEWVFGALLAYAVALILLPFVLIAAEVVGSGPGWVTGQGSLLTMWAAYVVSMWWAPLPSLGLGALFGLALAYALRGTRPWLPHLGAFAGLGAVCGVINVALGGQGAPMMWLAALAGALAAVVGYVTPMAWGRNEDRLGRAAGAGVS